jgi:hypothetical protein
VAGDKAGLADQIGRNYLVFAEAEQIDQAVRMLDGNAGWSFLPASVCPPICSPFSFVWLGGLRLSRSNYDGALRHKHHGFSKPQR